jgi:hypothetical protein
VSVDTGPLGQDRTRPRHPGPADDAPNQTGARPGAVVGGVPGHLCLGHHHPLRAVPAGPARRPAGGQRRPAGGQAGDRLAVGHRPVVVPLHQRHRGERQLGAVRRRPGRLVAWVRARSELRRLRRADRRRRDPAGVQHPDLRRGPTPTPRRPGRGRGRAPVHHRLDRRRWQLAGAGDRRRQRPPGRAQRPGRGRGGAGGAHPRRRPVDLPARAHRTGRGRRPAGRAGRRGLGDTAAGPAPVGGDGHHRRRHHRRRSVPAGGAGQRPHRGGPVGPGPQHHARRPGGGLPGARGHRTTAPAVPGRRLPRAAHPAHLHPGLRRAVSAGRRPTSRSTCR